MNAKWRELLCYWPVENRCSDADVYSRACQYTVTSLVGVAAALNQREDKETLFFSLWLNTTEFPYDRLIIEIFLHIHYVQLKKMYHQICVKSLLHCLI